MKKILAIVLAVAMMMLGAVALVSCNENETETKSETEKETTANSVSEIIVHTNAFFAPFEYFDGTDIKGVDIDVMALVGEKLGAKIKFENVEFSAIIDNVSKGVVCDAGAAGITITEERQEKVDFSIPYYTSIQYVIFAENDSSVATKTVDGVEYIVWEALAGKTIGVQTDTTGYIYTDGEINARADDEDYGYDGVLYGTNTKLDCYDSAQLAADAIGSYMADVVIVDELPAKYIVSKNASLKCLPLYYSGDTDAEDAPVEEQYAICVTKGNTELLDAINEVLTTLTVVGDDGKTEIDKLVMKHMGLGD